MPTSRANTPPGGLATCGEEEPKEQKPDTSYPSSKIARCSAKVPGVAVSIILVKHIKAEKAVYCCCRARTVNYASFQPKTSSNRVRLIRPETRRLIGAVYLGDTLPEFAPFALFLISSHDLHDLHWVFQVRMVKYSRCGSGLGSSLTLLLRFARLRAVRPCIIP